MTEIEESYLDDTRPALEKAETLVRLLIRSGIKFTVVYDAKSLSFGFGDEVCYVLNDLTTEILIKKNYNF